jgi:uncharacterized protein (UPF0297 family)
MLKASDLRSIQKEKTDNTKQIFKRILEECYKKLKDCNKKGYTSMNFTVNAIKIGYPLFDVSKAVKYITRKLKKGGFNVTANGNHLQIDWTR